MGEANFAAPYLFISHGRDTGAELVTLFTIAVAIAVTVTVAYASGLYLEVFHHHLGGGDSFLQEARLVFGARVHEPVGSRHQLYADHDRQEQEQERERGARGIHDEDVAGGIDW